VLNAAALEYDVVEGTRPGQLRSKVREAIREKRKQELSQPSSTTVSDPNFKVITPSKPIGGGTIIIGRVSWVEYLQGLNEGCIASLEDPPPKELKSDSDSKQEAAKDDQQTDNQDNNESESEFIINEKEFSVPQLDPIGYIHFYNRIGWKNIITRLYYALNSYEEFNIAGEEAVKISLGNTRQFKKEDLNLGKDEEKFFKGTLDEPTLDERIASKLSMYT
jgi:mitochondrial import inner membrane translocase subunit TIM54